MSTSTKEHKVTKKQVKDVLSLATDYKHVIIVMEYNLYVRLHIDPNEASSVDDRFTLFGGETANDRQYEQTKNTKDDVVKGDDCVDLIFTDLVPELKYWLEIDPGEEGDKYFAFKKLPWKDIERIARP